MAKGVIAIVLNLDKILETSHIRRTISGHCFTSTPLHLSPKLSMFLLPQSHKIQNMEKMPPYESNRTAKWTFAGFQFLSVRKKIVKFTISRGSYEGGGSVGLVVDSFFLVWSEKEASFYVHVSHKTTNYIMNLRSLFVRSGNPPIVQSIPFHVNVRTDGWGFDPSTATQRSHTTTSTSITT